MYRKKRALVVKDADGCVMWDCIPLAAREAVDHVRSLGGLKAIAASHPHYYGAVADWSEAFGDVPIYLHGDDRQWVTRPHPAIVSWTGDSRQLSDGITLVRTGGQFAGGTILHWRAGAEGRAALLTGDVAMVAMDRRSLSFMHSFPNYIRLNAKSVQRVARAVAPLAFDRIYGGGGAATSRPAQRQRLRSRCGDIWPRSRIRPTQTGGTSHLRPRRKRLFATDHVLAEIVCRVLAFVDAAA